LGGVVLLCCCGIVCDDVFDVVEGIAGETVIELMQEEQGFKEMHDLEKKMYT
jgi:hypothetical protein